MLKKIALIGFVFIISFKFTVAQSKYTLCIHNSITNNDIINIKPYKTSFNDTLQRYRELNEIILKFWKDEYITTTIDSIISDSFNLTAYINIGNKYKYLLINDSNNQIPISNKGFFKHNQVNNCYSNYVYVQNQINFSLLYFENNGYPFATIQFDSIVISDSCFTGTLVINKNKQYIIDSIIVKGTAFASSNYIQKFVGIKSKTLYNEAQNRNISKKIKEIDFFKETKPIEIEFFENKANILLFVDKIKANQFDGIIGIMPNDKNNRLVITGDIKFMLLNSFNKGELLAFRWHKFDKLSQDLKITTSYPFLLSSPFGVDLEYYLYKKDTSYITNKGKIGFKYIFEGNNHLKAFYEKQNTTLLFKLNNNNSTFPNYNSSNINIYGLEFRKQNLNNMMNPRKGYIIDIIASAGNKEIKINKDLPNIIYNDIKLKSTQYIYDADISFFIPTFRRSCIYLSAKSASIFNDYLFDNDLFRIGGLKTLKGFDEESIQASFYTILTAEYRYLYDEYSYLNIFWNGCHYEKNTFKSYHTGNPFGFGVGINFKTKLGVFSVNYALGKQDKEPIYPKRAKIHFGIINYF